MNFKISDLRERPEFFDTVADRIWQTWWKRHGVLPGYISARLRENLIGHGIPLALVAHDGDVFLGTASLLAADLDERPQYSPWVAAVWIEPAARGCGIGRVLIASACEAGLALGYGDIYLCARPEIRGYYIELGWRPIEEQVGPRHLTVFIRVRAA